MGGFCMMRGTATGGGLAVSHVPDHQNSLGLPVKQTDHWASCLELWTQWGWGGALESVFLRFPFPSLSTESYDQASLGTTELAQ